MDLDDRRCYEALKARDARFDGRFFVGVSTTGIYCRPICPARIPGRDRCSFYANAAAAERAGYRPCLRCRPELAPGYASVDAVRSAARWAAARIESGALNDGNVEQLAAQYGVSSRHLRRVIETELGVTPIELAQTRRLLLAKHLLTDSTLGMTQVALASGFSSVRRFNHLFKTRYGLNPTSLRRHGKPASDRDAITIKLEYRPPFDWLRILSFLVSRGAAGVECARGLRYVRTVRLGEHRGWFSAEPIAGRHALRLEVSSGLMPVLTPLLSRVRHVFDLDANPRIIEAHLTRDALLKACVRRQSGLRVPGAFDGFELALRAVLGQQVAVKAASTMFGRMAAAFGEAAVAPDDALKFFAPAASDIATADLRTLMKLGLTSQRAATVLHLARAVASGDLELTPQSDIDDTMKQLRDIPGIGAWTAHYIAMRALGYTDAFPHADLGLMKALNLRREKEMLARAELWRPWRAYAAHHLWADLSTR